MQIRLGMRIATVVSLVALPFGLPVERAADAAVARHDPPAGAARAAAAVPVLRPAAVTPKIVAVPVRSSYETATRAVSRDIGLSVALPDGHDLWLFGDTGVYQKTGSTWQRTGFLDGSTALLAKYTKGQVPRGGEVPAAKPARFVPVPTKVYLPDKSGRLCVQPVPTAAFSARWPTGAAVMSTNSARVLVTYSIVCVTHPKNNPVAARTEGWGYMLYNWKTHKIDRGPIDVFKPHTKGAAIAASKTFGWPVFANGKLTLFSFSCTQQYIACAAGKVYAATMAPTIPALDNPNSYKIRELFTDGSSPWEPLTISVSRYSDGPNSDELRLVEQTTIGGAYKIFSAPDAASPWHMVSSGNLPGCVNKTLFCFGLEGHPELSIPGSVFVSYKDPNSGPSGHVVVSAVPG
jgi:hypothetical protein